MLQIFDFRFTIADFWVSRLRQGFGAEGDAFSEKRPTPIEFRKSEFKNQQSAMSGQPVEVA